LDVEVGFDAGEREVLGVCAIVEGDNREGGVGGDVGLILGEEELRRG
jgi:hypothetical protein